MPSELRIPLVLYQEKLGEWHGEKLSEHLRNEQGPISLLRDDVDDDYGSVGHGWQVEEGEQADQSVDEPRALQSPTKNDEVEGEIKNHACSPCQDDESGSPEIVHVLMMESGNNVSDDVIDGERVEGQCREERAIDIRGISSHNDVSSPPKIDSGFHNWGVDEPTIKFSDDACKFKSYNDIENEKKQIEPTSPRKKQRYDLKSCIFKRKQTNESNSGTETNGIYHDSIQIRTPLTLPYFEYLNNKSRRHRFSEFCFLEPPYYSNAYIQYKKSKDSGQFKRICGTEKKKWLRVDDLYNWMHYMHVSNTANGSKGLWKKLFYGYQFYEDLEESFFASFNLVSENDPLECMISRSEFSKDCRLDWSFITAIFMPVLVKSNGKGVHWVAIIIEPIRNIAHILDSKEKYNKTKNDEY